MSRGNQSFAHLAHPSTRRAPRGDAPASTVSQAPAPSHVDSSSSAARASTTTTARDGARVQSKAKFFLAPGSRHEPGAWIVTVPLEARSLANARMHWRPLAALKSKQRTAVKRQLDVAWSGCRQPESQVFLCRNDGLTVTFTRIAPRELDDDNLRSAFKAVRDEVADWLGLKSDRDPRVTWAYAQRRDKPRTYGVEIRFEPREAGRSA